MLAEIAALRRRYPSLASLKFNDDVLPLKPDWFAAFSERYRREVALPFTCNLHPTLVTASSVAQLRAAGCTRVQLGVESGSERIRRTVLGRAISNPDLQRAIQLLQAAGLRVQTFNIVGFPGETIDEMWDTVQLNAGLRPDLAQCTIFYPYPGTALHAECHDLLRHDAATLTSYECDTPLVADFRRRTVIRFIRHYFKLLIAPRGRVLSAVARRCSRSSVGALCLWPAVLLYALRRQLRRHRNHATAS
ncbi:MAG TPA: radical SAM protein [bacterium]|nr:radical SAM protein [bacterium]